MTRILPAAVFAMLLTVSPVTVGPITGPQPVEARGCTGGSTRHPPKTIRVFRIHRRGTRIPARIEVWDFKRYVGVVMESGAWPRFPRASGQVGAQAIKQYGWWHTLHRTRGYTWRGRCYDIRDGDQFIRGHWRPWMSVNRSTRERVNSIWDVRLIKKGRLFRTGWRGNSGRDGWHLYEDSITRLARRGWSTKRLFVWALSPVRIHGL